MIENMGGNMSDRRGKYFGNARSKSEDHLAHKYYNIKSTTGNMGKLLYKQYRNNSTNNISCVNNNHNHNNNNNNNNDNKIINNNNWINICKIDVKPHAKINDDYDNVIKNNEMDDYTFEVKLNKSARGLGFSIDEYDGFIVIKQLFDLEPAAQCGLLKSGDIILSANGKSLKGYTAFEALQVLRTIDNPVVFTMRRPRHPITTSFKSFTTTSLQTSIGINQEFEITITKVGGSLGFTLRRDDESHEHLVRTLVKEPAISDGRIKPGDVIACVNDVHIGDMTHEEAVKFLRDCGCDVTLKVIRKNALNGSVTSLTSSQFQLENPKPLRREAIEMLNNLAEKKNSNKEMMGTDETDKKTYKQEVELDVPVLNKFDELAISNEMSEEPVSLPTLDIDANSSFNHQDHAYHSMNVSKHLNDTLELNNNQMSKAVCGNKNNGLLKWKGITLRPEEEEKEDKQDSKIEVITVQLQRGWNTRLGFSLSNNEDNVTIISRIHPDSVAGRDGRLRVNDRIIKINDENMENVKTNELIEILRNVKGIVSITVARRKFS